MLSSFHDPFDELIYFEDERHKKMVISETGFPAFLQSQPIWNTDFEIQRQGSTGIGHTFEKLLGIVENNKKEADLFGFEVKTSTSRIVTLFTANPTSDRNPSVIASMVDRFGEITPEKIRLNKTLKVGQPCRVRDGFITVIYDAGQEELQIVSDVEGLVGSWSLDAVRRSAGKLAQMMICYATKSSIGTVRYKEFQLHREFSFERFFSMLLDGRIEIHLRAKRDGSIRDHGTAFRIRRTDIALMYDYSATYLSNRDDWCADIGWYCGPSSENRSCDTMVSIPRIR